MVIAPTLIGTSTTPSLQIPADQLGPAGVRGNVHVVPIRQHETKYEEARLLDGTVRRFVTSALFGKSPAIADRISGQFTANDGASYLEAPSDAVFLKFYAGQDTFTISKNQDGELSLATYECEATNELECRLRFLRGITPILDHLAYVANVSLFVQFVRVVDTENEITTIEYVSPYRKATLSPHFGTFAVEMQPIYAMYREAKNANSDFYRFLCLYKILEGVLLKMKADVNARAKKAKIALVHRKLTVPRHPAIDARFQRYVGTPLKVFFDHVLTKQFRDGVAHYILDTGTILNMSDPESADTYASLILITEVCVREAISNHESLLNQIAP